VKPVSIIISSNPSIPKRWKPSLHPASVPLDGGRAGLAPPNRRLAQQLLLLAVIL
jgi:hypothetical protein